MPESSLLQFERLSEDDRALLDSLCDEFEAALKAEDPLRIERLLPRFNGQTARKVALKELIGLELYHCQRNRTTLTVDNYNARFPEFTDVVAAAFDDSATLLAPGTSLGPYQIRNQLGAGGMGVVYAALDNRLDREVAVKVLPLTFSHNRPRWLERFHREAKILAKFSHPNIATLFGFEELGELSLCVMELAPGQTLAQILDETGPIEIATVTTVFQQIAAALEYAHSQGVVHRDLKPANVVINHEGNAKVLDFGLATTTFDPDQPATDVTRLTDVDGLHVGGTVPYMSPEQLRGQQVDKRTDVWAFGCCLYEALTARRAFDGESHADLVSAIIDGDVDWEALPEETPPAIRFLLKRCLQKDPKQRLRDLGDAWIDDAQVDELVTSTTAVVRQSGVVNRRWALAVLLAICSIVMFAIWAWRPNPKPIERPTRWCTVTLPETKPVALAEWADLSEGRPSIALTPDGNQLIYVARVADVPKLCVRRLDQQPERREVRVIEGTDGAFNPFVSPNGNWIGFFANGLLKKVATRGGRPIPLCEVSEPYGATWADDGSIYVAGDFGGELFRVSNDGRKRMIAQHHDVQGYTWPEALPGNKGVLVYREWTGIVWVSPTGEEKVVYTQGRHARYVASDRSGHLVFAERGVLMAVAFDLATMQVRGSAAQVVDHVRTESRGCAQFCTDRDGTLIYIPGGDAARGELVKRNIDTGNEEPLGFAPDAYGTFALSPNGKQLAVVKEGVNRDIWVLDLDRRTATRLTYEGSNNRTPIWSPDGEYVLFSSNRYGRLNIYRKSPYRTGPAERLTNNSQNHFASHWFKNRDGSWLAITAEPDGPNRMLAADGSVDRPLPETQIAGQLVSPSPNGRWIAHGGLDILVQHVPDSGKKLQVSTGGGEEALWYDENHIVYRNKRQWMLAEIETEPELKLKGKPTRLFEGDYLNVPDYSYAIMPSRQSFILLRGTEPAQTTQVCVAVNWSDELRRSAPANEPD